MNNTVRQSQGSPRPIKSSRSLDFVWSVTHLLRGEKREEKGGECKEGSVRRGARKEGREKGGENHIRPILAKRERHCALRQAMLGTGEQDYQTVRVAMSMWGSHH